MANFLKYWFPLYLYAALIFYISSIPKPPVPEIDIPFLDKVLHIAEYTIFGLLAARAFKSSPREVFFKNFKILAVLASVLYGLSDEFHQLFVYDREFSMLDIVSDGVGGVLGVTIYKVVTN